jgi:hypothetical protein
MKRDLGELLWEKEFFKEELAFKIAEELAGCLVYESFHRIKVASNAKNREDRYKEVFLAFCFLGKSKTILRKYFEEIKQDLYKEAKENLLSSDFSEDTLREAAERGLIYEAARPFPTKIGLGFFHYGFVADMVYLELGKGPALCVKWLGKPWENPKNLPNLLKEINIRPHIYGIMQRKINVWRDSLNDDECSIRGTRGWLERLEKNINDPDWLSKVEELLLKVRHLEVQIVSSDC